LLFFVNNFILSGIFISSNEEWISLDSESLQETGYLRCIQFTISFNPAAAVVVTAV
jgi:hypothetical protein